MIIKKLQRILFSGISWVILLLNSHWICSQNNYNPKFKQIQIQETSENLVVVTINPEVTYQEIEHFGASDAWSCQFVGNWPSSKKNSIADLLFSNQLDNKGNPKGIGLSIWRFNIGAGSAEQGTSSDIKDEWRRSESFLLPDGTYDWSKQKGQVWFAKAAKERGVKKLLLFSNSPPVYLTKNGKANTNSGETNLDPSNYKAFGDFLTTVIDCLHTKHGLSVDYISPINEPQWEWKNGQEGCPYYNTGIAEMTKALNASLTQKGLKTTIDIAEAASINFLYDKGNKGDRGNQIEQFYDAKSPNYIGDLSNIGHAISGHSYFTTYPFSKSIEKRLRLSKKLKELPNLKYWMSEYCILESKPNEMKGQGRDLGIDPALYMARVIHTDLEIAQASAWHWWLAISPYNYKDGLVYIDLNKEDGQFYESKLLWALGNYSFFIKPGFKRIKSEVLLKKDSDLDGIDENFMISSYKDPVSSRIVTVVINSSENKIPLQLKNLDSMTASVNSYITSATKNLEKENIEKNGVFLIPNKSVVTIAME